MSIMNIYFIISFDTQCLLLPPYSTRNFFQWQSFLLYWSLLTVYILINCLLSIKYNTSNVICHVLGQNILKVQYFVLFIVGILIFFCRNSSFSKHFSFSQHTIFFIIPCYVWFRDSHLLWQISLVYYNCY